MAVLSDAQREAGWTGHRLSDVIELIGGGTPKTTVEEYWNGSIPWLSVIDFSGDSRYVSHASKSITQLGLENSSTKLLNPGDLILSARGTVGELAQLTAPMAFNQSCFGIRSNFDGLSQNYLYYLLLTVIGELRQNSHGSIFSTVNRKTFESVDIVLPPLEEQERIAGILGSLDDKIEANTRLIQTLLDTADSVFQKFYSECELSESTYASLEVYGGGTPSTKNEIYWGGDIHWLTPTDVTSLGSPILFDTARKLTEDGLNACSSKLHPAGSIMMTSRATIGAFAINQYPAATNQGFIVAVPQREEERWWIYHHMKKDVPEMINAANGTTFLEISRRTFKGLPYNSLSEKDMERFHAVLNPLYELVKSSEQENLQLAETRDALIKRLIG